MKKMKKKKKSKSHRFAYIESKLYKTINKQQPKKQPKKMPHFAFRAPSIFFLVVSEKKKIESQFKFFSIKHNTKHQTQCLTHSNNTNICFQNQNPILCFPESSILTLTCKQNQNQTKTNRHCSLFFFLFFFC